MRYWYFGVSQVDVPLAAAGRRQHTWPPSLFGLLRAMSRSARLASDRRSRRGCRSTRGASSWTSRPASSSCSTSAWSPPIRIRGSVWLYPLPMLEDLAEVRGHRRQDRPCKAARQTDRSERRAGQIGRSDGCSRAAVTPAYCEPVEVRQMPPRDVGAQSEVRTKLVLDADHHLVRLRHLVVANRFALPPSGSVGSKSSVPRNRREEFVRLDEAIAVQIGGLPVDVSGSRAAVLGRNLADRLPFVESSCDAKMA